MTSATESQPDFPIRFYRALRFYNLIQDFWSDDLTGMSDPVYYFTADPFTPTKDEAADEYIVCRS